MYNYNRFQACRFGLDGTLVHPKTHETLSLREDILATLRHLEPHAAALDCIDAMERLYPVMHEGSDAAFLRNRFEEKSSLEGVVDAALDHFRGDAR